jgi:hypothetical protein
MSKQKQEFKDEVDLEERSRKCCVSNKVICQYLISEQTKKARACKIGIFTVFLVVMVITMLKSVIDSSPILFVRIGQNTVGAIDYKITTPTGENLLINGNKNWYAIDPFGSIIDPDDTPDDPDDPEVVKEVPTEQEAGEVDDVKEVEPIQSRTLGPITDKVLKESGDCGGDGIIDA